MSLRFAFLFVLSTQLYGAALAQIATPVEDPYRKYGETVITRYRVGISVEATKGAVRDVFGMVAIPFECDEQEVIVADEDISPEIDSVKYRTLDSGVRQMLVTIPYLPSNTEAHAILTFEVRTKVMLPPDEALTADLVPPKKPDRELKKFLGRSPYIQHNHGKIRRALRDIFKEPETDIDGAEPDEKTVDLATFEENTEKPAIEHRSEDLTPWQRVEKIYDFVQKSIEYVEGNDHSAVETLERKKGDCHDVSALFVALCRADKIPARMVWVHEHQYPEFCLADAEGNLHWFPCESSGMRAFGEMPTARVIMQKGENFRIPERPGQTFRYASEYLTAAPAEGGGKPRVRFIREKL